MSGPPKAAEKRAGWPALCRDVKGLRVRLRREAGNAWGSAPAGTEGVIEWRASNWSNLSFRSKPCDCCGVSVRMSGLTRAFLEPIVEQ